MLENLTVNLSPDEWTGLIGRTISHFKMADIELPEIVMDATDSNGQFVVLHMRLTHFSIIDMMALGITDSGTITIHVVETNRIIAILQQEGDSA